MSYTIAEKILGRASRAGVPVRAGTEVEVKPDYVLGYDFPGYLDLIFKQMKEEFGIERVAEPERFALFIDHMVPANTPEEEDLHIVTRTWCAENGVKLHEREGIGHQVAAEAGYAVPGGFVVHFDGHIAQLGAFGTLAIGIQRDTLPPTVHAHAQGRCAGITHEVHVVLTGIEDAHAIPSRRGQKIPGMLHQALRVEGVADDALGKIPHHQRRVLGVHQLVESIQNVYASPCNHRVSPRFVGIASQDLIWMMSSVSTGASLPNDATPTAARVCSPFSPHSLT